MSVCEGDTIRFDIQFSAGDKSQLQFFHDGRRVEESDGGGVGITFANDVASLTIQGGSSEAEVAGVRIRKLRFLVGAKAATRDATGYRQNLVGPSWATSALMPLCRCSPRRPGQILAIPCYVPGRN